MSDPDEGGVTTTLEEVFSSHTFARPRPPAADSQPAVGGVSVDEGVIAQHVGGIPRPALPSLSVPAEDTGTDGQLEEVFLSSQFGKRLTLLWSLVPADPPAGAASAAETVAVPFPTHAQQEHNRYRAVAAVSGIAAAALVVAGVSSGTGHQGPPRSPPKGRRSPRLHRAGPGPSPARRRPRASPFRCARRRPQR
jgi:hypothetical protein